MNVDTMRKLLVARGSHIPVSSSQQNGRYVASNSTNANVAMVLSRGKMAVTKRDSAGRVTEKQFLLSLDEGHYSGSRFFSRAPFFFNSVPT